MKTITTILFASVLLSLTGSQNTTAYICVSPSAKKYHLSKSCSGLQRCTHEIRRTTIDEAKQLGYTNCLLEQ